MKFEMNRSVSKKRNIQESNMRLERRWLSESDVDTEILTCMAEKAGITLVDLMKLIPCTKVKDDPSVENIEACIKAAQPIILEKNPIDFKDPIGSAKRITEILTGMAECLKSSNNGAIEF
jgi:hypothetical protein